MPEGQLLWEPSAEALQRADMTHYMRWLDRDFASYDELWRWSVGDLEGFWESLWEYFGVKASRPYERVLGRREMPGAEWFRGAELNYAEHIFRMAADDRPAIVHASELRELSEVSWGELRRQAARIEAGLRGLGVQRGDRVVAYMPNIPETVAALLACASIGAIWSSAAPEFGAPTVIDRFKQIEPKVLLAVDGYRYGGKDFDRRERVRELERSMPSLERTVLLPYLGEEGDWDEVFAEEGELAFEQVPFDHPLWVLYSSGTTGLPKAIVQGQGGILLEHLKNARLHLDLGPEDRFLWFTTTGWMMWNFLVGGLLAGSTIVLYDGQPDPDKLWGFVADAGVSCFGTSAGFIAACMKAGVEPRELPAVRSVGSTGSPLPAEGFEWVYQHVKRDLWLFSTSGGTDLCTAFVGGTPLLPVYAGELQARCLGASVEAWDEEGRALTDEVGELVITEPMPSMPLFFWNDPDGERYRSSYFDTYPGVWRHGDWIKITARGGAVIYGRSDSTINRHGVRMGTSEIYSAVEALPEVLDSLVIDVQRADGEAWMPLFVVLREGERLDDELRSRIRGRLREHCSPRHVPDEILQVEEIPRTLTGKKLEIPVKKILMGADPDRTASRDSLANPASLDFFSDLAGRVVSPTR
jgi:acetoacetyl-CoA synthetase